MPSSHREFVCHEWRRLRNGWRISSGTSLPHALFRDCWLTKFPHPSLASHASDDADASDGCGNCCGRNLVTDAEDNRRIERYASRHHIEPVASNLGGRSGREHMCGWLDSETRRCRIYPERPKVCRCWGSPHDGKLLMTRPGQPCGLRADMLDVWRRRGPLGSYDTWTSEWTEVR